VSIEGESVWYFVGAMDAPPSAGASAGTTVCTGQGTTGAGEHSHTLCGPEAAHF